MRAPGLKELAAVHQHEQAGGAGVPDALVGVPYTVPVAGARRVPDEDGIFRRAREPECPTLSASQERALSLLLAGSSITVTARVLGLTRQTVSRWVHSPAFSREFNRQRQQAMAASMQHLSGLVGQSVQALQDGLAPGQDIGVRLRAAAIVLETVGVRHARLVDLPDVLPADGEGAGMGPTVTPLLGRRQSA
jgi:hypothetical protein